MSQEAIVEPGAVRRLGPVLSRLRARNVFLVTGKASYGRSGAAEAVAKLASEFRFSRFNDFQPTPRFPEPLKGLQAYRREKFDAIVAIGGGSVLDMAKMIALLAEQDAEPLEVIGGKRPLRPATVPIIAIPTTSGSGSEATHFAVVYVDGAKHSLAHPSMLPEVALVDPDLSSHLPPALTAVTGLDAFSQAVESFWSIHSSPESRKLSAEAIGLARENLAEACFRPTPAARQSMCLASYRAGQAINLTRTTAPHALSYAMTWRSGVRHGHAVALTLGAVWLFNSQVTDGDVADPRGASHVRSAIDELNGLLGWRDAESAAAGIARFIEELELPARLSGAGIRTAEERELIAQSVNAERLGNNPRKMTGAHIRQLLTSIA